MRGPGIVRELKNIVERAMVLSQDAFLDAHLLPPEIAGRRSAFSSEDGALKTARRTVQRLDEMERDYILDVLDAHEGNRSVTARVLGIARSTLQDKLKKYGVEEPSS